VWLKAKPEWARGSRLVRITPRLNPQINDYWMCDIGRFQYHWIEGENRLRRPLVRDKQNVQQPAAWHDMQAMLLDRLAAAGRANPDGVRFLLSAHASHEEFFLFRRLAEELIGGTNGIAVTWQSSRKSQPAVSKFKVPEIDAPNLAGARAMGLVRGGAGEPAAGPDLDALSAAVKDGRVTALYVFDPGPDGSLGDVEWIVRARASGKLPLLVVQGVLLTELARAADFVLPGVSFVEKEASYTNDQGRLQAVSRAIPSPGEAIEDWQILVNLAAGLGVQFGYKSSADVRADISARLGRVAGLEDVASLTFGRPTSAKHWLQASNPSERWKWDFMFQDLPPVKFDGEPFSTNFAGVIPLKEVK
jgi:predicted molibdopterin-dependent oxidoreductase YjgC